MAADWTSAVGGETLLLIALGNTKHRASICNYLLDEGADASVTLRSTGGNCLHILLARVLSKANPENYETDLLLLRRLLASGADINGVDLEEGTPLECFLMRIMSVPDEWKAIPYYDALFAQEDLDLLKIGKFNRSTYESIWRSLSGKIMLEYSQHYMRERGIEVPNLPPATAPRIVKG